MLLGSHILQSYPLWDWLALGMHMWDWNSRLSSSGMYQWSTLRSQIQAWNLSIQWVRTEAKHGWRLSGEKGSPEVKPQKQGVWSLMSVMPAAKYFCIWMVIVLVTTFRQDPTQADLELNVFASTSWVMRLKVCVLNTESKGPCHHAWPETKPSLWLFTCISQWVLFLSLHLRVFSP